jgi:AraC-like DNA-binding protein
MDRGASKIWTSPALPGVECFRARALVHHYQRHSHDSYAIGVIEDGVGGNSCRGSTHRHPPGTIVAMNPDEAHTGYAVDNKPLSYRMFYVAPDALRSLVLDLDVFSSGMDNSRASVETSLDAARTSARATYSQIRFCDVAIKDRECASELLDFHRRWEVGDDEFLLESAFAALFGKLIHRHATGALIPGSGKEPRAVRLVKDYLEARYRVGVRLADLVSLTQLDRAYLIRSFRRVVGMPPHRYLTQIRVREAKRLIGKGRPLAEVAAEAGFADQSHLNRHFKSLTGLTPGRYAQQVTFVQDVR